MSNEDVRKTVPLTLPEDDYVFKFGAAFFATSWIEVRLRYKIYLLGEIFDLYSNPGPGSSLGKVIEAFLLSMKQSENDQLIEMREWFVEPLRKLVERRNDLGHGLPITDADSKQKLYRITDSKRFVVEHQDMNELIELVGEIYPKLDELRAILEPMKDGVEI